LEKDTRHKVKNRLAWLRRVVAVSLIAGLLVSAKAWVSDRPYPLVPPIGIGPSLPYPADHIFFALLVALLVGVALFRWRVAGSLALTAPVLAAFFVLQDISRLQPWLYQYSFMLAAVGLSGIGRLDAQKALNACRLIIAFTYFWSGLQKANASFVKDDYPWLLEPLLARLPPAAEPLLLPGAYAVPVVEVAIGLGLLGRRTRKPAVVGALLMHVFILFAIGPFGHNWNSLVWPWNLAMIAFVLILFWRPPDEPSLTTILRPRGSVCHAAILVLFAFMPALNFFGLWDSYLSSSLYSGRTEKGYVWTLDGGGLRAMSINRVALNEMNLPGYPEERVYKKVFAKRWCEETSASALPVLAVHSTPEIFSGERSVKYYRCEDVRAVGAE
jgi:hypothetical protein